MPSKALGSDTFWLLDELLDASNSLTSEHCSDWASLASLSFLRFACLIKEKRVGTALSLSCGLLGPKPGKTGLT